MDFRATSPIWLQVATRLKGEIAAGRLPPGSKLPGGRELALQYEINPNTAARVYQELERENLCQTKRGLGTFVTEDESRVQALRASMAQEAIREFLDRLSVLGFSSGEAIRMIEEETNDA